MKNFVGTSGISGKNQSDRMVTCAVGTGAERVHTAIRVTVLYSTAECDYSYYRSKSNFHKRSEKGLL